VLGAPLTFVLSQDQTLQFKTKQQTVVSDGAAETLSLEIRREPSGEGSRRRFGRFLDRDLIWKVTR
jgi:hypothetical protein